jgi:F-type H+-transporting ATPase subunit delta
MKSTKIEYRYARALFELALEQKSLERVNEDLQLVANTTTASRDLRHMLQSPVIKKEKKSAIIRSIFGSRISKLTLDFLLLLNDKRRENNIAGICINFLDIYKDHAGIATITVTSAVPVPETTKKRLKEVLEAKTGKIVEFIEKIDTSLIGGVVIQHKSWKYDASLRRQIENLRREFEINLYIKEI